jgi:hypothetical protein
MARFEIPNPGLPGGRQLVNLLNPCSGVKPVAEITDRAKRYRANADGCRPDGPKACAYCGSTQNVGVHHVDGNEDNTTRRNLKFACKSCNAKIANEHKRVGKGKRTRQFNPVPNLAQYSIAAAGHQRGSHDAGGKVIHDTPAEVRSQYAREIWKRRRAHGTDKRVPF